MRTPQGGEAWGVGVGAVAVVSSGSAALHTTPAARPAEPPHDDCALGGAAPSRHLPVVRHVEALAGDASRDQRVALANHSMRSPSVRAGVRWARSTISAGSVTCQGADQRRPFQ